MLDARTPNLGVNAGVLQVEQPLRWHRASGDYDAVQGALSSAATRDVVTINAEGKLDVIVTNSYNITDPKSTNNGSVYLDYLRFSPIIDDND